MEYPETRTESEGWGDRASHATYHLPGRPMHSNVCDEGCLPRTVMKDGVQPAAVTASSKGDGAAAG